MKSLTYNVVDVFKSIQGEGTNAGRSAIFVRFFGCNLKCPFCDEADHNDKSKLKTFSVIQLTKTIVQLSKGRVPLVILTGGEPTLQNLDPLIEELNKHCFEVAVETNGFNLDNCGMADWITLSPKASELNLLFEDKLSYVNEVKILFEKSRIKEILRISKHFRKNGKEFWYPIYLQPIDSGKISQNEQTQKDLVEFALEYPEFRISLQLHKILRIK